MKLTLAFIERTFDDYNELYWHGMLRKPIFVISHSKRCFGCFRVQRTRKGANYTERLTLHVSDSFVRTETEYTNTILHEMIHLYLNQIGVVDRNLNGHRDSHGRNFMKEAARINARGWNIQKYNPFMNELVRKTSRMMIAYKAVSHGDEKYFLFSVNPKYKDGFVCGLRRHAKTYVDWFIFSSNEDKYNVYRACRTKATGNYIDKMTYDCLRRNENITETI